MLYRHENLVLNTYNNKRSVLYKNGKILFMGNGYIAILQFITESNHHPDVEALFEKQMSQRETAKINGQSIEIKN